MDSTSTRRWPRFHVHLPVFVAVDPGVTDIVVPGLVCELSRSGVELYGGVNRQPGEEVEIDFPMSSGRIIRIVGIVRSRTGFCFGVEFSAVRTSHGMSPDALELDYPSK
jgi:hypothetical protein